MQLLVFQQILQDNSMGKGFSKTYAEKLDIHKEQMNLEIKKKVNFRLFIGLNVKSKKIKII